MTDMDYGAMRFWWDVAITLIVLGNFIYTWVANRSDRNTAAIAHANVRIDTIDHAVKHIQADVEHLPNYHEIGTVHEKINDVAGQVKAIDGQLTGINHTLQLINEYLIKEGHT